jgi:biopolymer transport protein ExbB
MIFELFETVTDFLATGGDVLKLIFVTTFLLWFMIIERFMFFKFRLPDLLRGRIQNWKNHSDKSSWFAHRVRDAEISIIKQELHRNVGTIKTLVSLCPLLGLLGTVTGMIAVFDVMALTGTGNARLMASGISMATIPTMAGMVAALSGLYFGNLFDGKAKKALADVEDQMELEF